MGYCPRCGENDALAGPSVLTRPIERPALRIPVTSNIVRLRIDTPGVVISIGGTRFRVDRDGDDHVLRALE